MQSTNDILKVDSNDELLIYQNEDGTIKLDVLFDSETVWLSADQMGQLFGEAKSTISEHLKTIFEDGELRRDSVVRNSRTTASGGKNYDVVFYYLGCHYCHWLSSTSKLVIL